MLNYKIFRLYKDHVITNIVLSAIKKRHLKFSIKYDILFRFRNSIF